MPEEAPPAGGGTSEGDGFLGGFSADTPAQAWEPWVPGQWTGHVNTTLGELASIGAGGYRESDTWEPANYDPPTVAQLQSLLVEAGLLDLDDLDHDSLGYFDDATRGAYRDLLTRSNAAGATWESTLARMRQNPVALDRKPTGAQRQPFVARVTNPDDLKALIRETLREKSGTGEVGDDVIAAAIREFQGEEVSQQRALYDMSTAGAAGGTVVDAPDPRMFAERKAQEINPVGYSAHKFLDKFSVIKEALAGGAG